MATHIFYSPHFVALPPRLRSQNEITVRTISDSPIITKIIVSDSLKLYSAHEYLRIYNDFGNSFTIQG